MLVAFCKNISCSCNLPTPNNNSRSVKLNDAKRKAMCKGVDSEILLFAMIFLLFVLFLQRKHYISKFIRHIHISNI